MTGDDHANGGTAGRFEQYIAASPPGCSVADWECIRGTSYIFPNTPLTNAQANSYVAQGFEIGLHVNTNCARLHAGEHRSDFYSTQLAQFAHAVSAGCPPGTTNRTHCIAWSDYTTQAQVERATTASGSTRTTTTGRARGCTDRPGMFTGSGMPMRFADTDGHDDRRLPGGDADDRRVGPDVPVHADTLLDNALGRAGLLRRVHRQHAHRRHRRGQSPTRSSPRRRRATCR